MVYPGEFILLYNGTRNNEHVLILLESFKTEFYI